MKKNKYAPIILFTYCRPEHTKQTVEALLKNKEAVESDLFIYSDAPQNKNALEGVKKTREYIKAVSGFKSVSIVERKENWGLAKNLIDGITTVINKFGRAIIVEDDIVTSPYFLRFMNEALERYKNTIEVATIHGYMMPLDNADLLPEAFLSSWHGCWGWATWKENWDAFNPDALNLYQTIRESGRADYFDLDRSQRFTAMLMYHYYGIVNSWAIRWYASNFVLGRLCLHPNKSLVKQLGLDGGPGATHSRRINTTCFSFSTRPINWDNVQMGVQEDMMARASIVNYKRKHWNKRYRLIWFLHCTHLEKLLFGNKLRRLRWYY